MIEIVALAAAVAVLAWYLLRRPAAPLLRAVDDDPLRTGLRAQLVYASGTGDIRVDIPDGEGVVGVELLRAWVPLGDYIVSDHNQVFQIRRQAGQVLDYVVPPGNGWGANTLLADIQAGIRKLGFCSFSTAVQPRTGVVRFRAGEPFEVLFGSGSEAERSVATLLGFPPRDVASTEVDATTHQVVSPSRADLSGDRFINVRTLELADEHPPDGRLAQIPISTDSPVFYYDAGRPLVRRFPRPRNLKSLLLTFRTQDAGRLARKREALADGDSPRWASVETERPYDFHGLSFDLTLVVYTIRYLAPD